MKKRLSIEVMGKVVLAKEAVFGVCVRLEERVSLRLVWGKRKVALNHACNHLHTGTLQGGVHIP